MSERGVCICPDCGCQFSDWRKVELEEQVRKYRRAEINRLWLFQPRYSFLVWRLARKVRKLQGQPLPPSSKGPEVGR